jgi:hypothetical protein
MLVARQSFSAVHDGKPVAVHRGRTRIADDHELARRFPHRWEPVNRREDARIRFRDRLDTAETYDQYIEMLDKATARLALVEQRGEVRVV